MGDLYKQKVLLKEFTNSPVYDQKNSYELGSSTQGPGHGPSTGASNTDAAQFNDKVMFPKDKDLSDEQKGLLLIKFFEDEIKTGTWDDETKKEFRKLMSFLIGHRSLEGSESVVKQVSSSEKSLQPKSNPNK